MTSLKELQGIVTEISMKYFVGRCEGCNKIGAKYCPAMTAYHWDKKTSDVDPNRDVFLCDMCYQRYVEHWSEMWAEYQSSQGG